MKQQNWLLIAASLMIITGITFIGNMLHKKITLIIDGEAKTVTSWALTIEGLLATQGLHLNPEDQLIPSVDTWLREGDTVVINRATPISIFINDQLIKLNTAERIVGNIIAQAGIFLFPKDSISIDGNATDANSHLSPGRSHTLQIKQASTILLKTPDGITEIISAAPTLGKALWESGIRIKVGDYLNPSLDTPLVGPMEAYYTPAREITIQIGNQSIQAYSAAETVGQVLADVGLALQGLDHSLPAPEKKIPKNGQIEVVRVQEEVLLSQEPLPNEIEYQADATLEIDNQRILESGAFGVKAQQQRVRYENGAEVSRETQAEWIAREPVNRVIGYGTNITKKILNSPSGKIEYWRAVPMYATSYSPCRLGKPDYCNDITASGLKLQKGVAGVAKSWYSSTVGLKVFVPGYGVATIADFGNGLPGKNLIDLGFSESDFEVWHQDVTVYFLWPPPPPEQILWVLP